MKSELSGSRIQQHHSPKAQQIRQRREGATGDGKVEYVQVPVPVPVSHNHVHDNLDIGIVKMKMKMKIQHKDQIMSH